MKRSSTIYGVTAEQLNNYSPAEYDAVQQPDGTFNLVPLQWTTQAEFMDYAFGCGDDL